MTETANALAAPTTHEGLLGWVREIAALTRPDAVHWCDGSQAEWDRLTSLLVAKGTYTRLAKRLNSFLCRTDPSDAVRAIDRTFICSEREEDAGPTNHWMAPDRMRAELSSLFDGCMTGRTMYVVPFCIGPLGSPISQLGVEITDSEHAVATMRIGTRMGTGALRMLEERGTFVKCVHSVGSPLLPGEADSFWPCNKTKYIAHFPQTREVWSFGSGFGDNSALGKKSYALRIASVMAREEGWMAEHMLVLRVTPPTGEARYIAAALPAGCGKTNLAMLSSTIPGWTAELVADDVAWLKLGPDGTLRAVNAEAGILGVTGQAVAPTNANAVAAMALNTIFTNVALTDDGDVWWEGLTPEPPAHLVSWRGESWTPESPEPAAHPRAKFTSPASQCISIAGSWDDPEGVPISAVLFAGRRFDTMPLVLESFDWQHGVFLGACVGVQSRRTGQVTRDPFSMNAFCGYNMADYFGHWLEMGRKMAPEKRPLLFHANWFTRGSDGGFLWPGFDDNMRILRWIVERVNGVGGCERTAIGYVPPAGAIDVDGTPVTGEDLAALLAVDSGKWRQEAASVGEFFKIFGDRLPAELWGEHRSLTERIG